MGVPARQQETYPPAHMHAGEVWVSERLGDCGDYSCHSLAPVLGYLSLKTSLNLDMSLELSVLLAGF